MSENVVREELQAVYDSEGDLTPSLVLDRARSEKSPLHGYFEWNDSVAGEKFRLGQAQKLITKVKVVYRNADGESKKVRKWHAVQAPTQDWNYRPIDEIADDDLASKILLADMRRDIENLKKRYANVAGFFEMAREILKTDAA